MEGPLQFRVAVVLVWRFRLCPLLIVPIVLSMLSPLPLDRASRKASLSLKLSTALVEEPVFEDVVDPDLGALAAAISFSRGTALERVHISASFSTEKRC